MKKTKNAFYTMILFTLSFSSIYGQELDEKLKLLEPFINKKWEAKEPLINENAKMEKWFEIIENGKAIKRTDTLNAINATSVYFYYWDFDKQEIGVFGIHNNGNFAYGHIKEEDGKILYYGYGTFPDIKLEFRNTYEFTEDGKFFDKFFSFENGEWKSGHSRVFYEKKE
ncbi:hypothetical protein ACFLSV_05810 [Bacteroidota bacterium]